jgi:hypothetical protein
MALRSHKLGGALGDGPSAGAKVENMFPGSQGGVCNHTFHDGQKPPVDLTHIDV